MVFNLCRGGGFLQVIENRGGNITGRNLSHDFTGRLYVNRFP
ncbi:MAG: hypothetical protein ACK5U7_15880 [Bacteroidota bacterium]